MRDRSKAFKAPTGSPRPQRSLNSLVLKWPDRDVVDRAVRVWAQEAGKQFPGLRRVGYFGSYAPGTGESEAIWIWWRSWTMTLSRLDAGRCDGISVHCPFRRKSWSASKSNGSTSMGEKRPRNFNMNFKRDCRRILLCGNDRSGMPMVRRKHCASAGIM